VLAGNGRVYFAPRNADNIGQLDPVFNESNYNESSPLPAMTEYFFEMTEFRGSIQGCAGQLAELRLFDYDCNTLVPSRISGMPGAIFKGSEGPAKVFDGSVHTKYCDTSNQGNFFFFFESPVVIASYSWVTANDATNRDVVSWNLKARPG